MSGYKKITKEDAEIFLKLYEKYQSEKMYQMKEILKTLPTNVIERCFNDIKFFEKDFDVLKLDEATFGFGGLCGWSKIEDLAKELEYCNHLESKEYLDYYLRERGFKVNRKNIGVPDLE